MKDMYRRGISVLPIKSKNWKATLSMPFEVVRFARKDV
jgi:hypothetical protein